MKWLSDYVEKMLGHLIHIGNCLSLGVSFRKDSLNEVTKHRLA